MGRVAMRRLVVATPWAILACAVVWIAAISGAHRWEESSSTPVVGHFCVTPLFIAVLNDPAEIENIAQMVAAHNTWAERAAQGYHPPVCMVQMHVLDNTGCTDAAVIDAANRRRASRGVYFDAQAHLRDETQGGAIRVASARHPRGHSSAKTMCDEWDALVARLTDPPTPPRGPRFVVSRGIGSSTFGQSMNWFLLQTLKTYAQEVFLWAHTDAVVSSPRIIADLLSASTQLIHVDREPFSYILTAYDALCVVHAASIVKTVGLFDEFMWYYSEVDLMLRAELAGLPMLQWDHQGMVQHHPKSSLRRSGQRSRFQRSVELRVPLWQSYYNARWASEFGIPQVDQFNVSYMHIKRSCRGVNSSIHGGRSSTSIRSLVDAIGAYLDAPQRLTIRGATFHRYGDERCASIQPSTNAHRSSSSVPMRQLLSEAVVYFLPVDRFDQWSDKLVALWETKDNGAFARFLALFDIESINFFQQGFDKK